MEGGWWSRWVGRMETAGVGRAGLLSAAISTTVIGEAIEVPEKWAVATLRGRTNVVDKAGGGGPGTASTVSTSTRKGSSAGVGWGNQQGYKGFEMKSRLQSEPCNTKDGKGAQEMVSSERL
eukprot:scaffold3708_cov107-Amphora_coffeaeformis.AAC.1